MFMYINWLEDGATETGTETETETETYLFEIIWFKIIFVKCTIKIKQFSVF